ALAVELLPPQDAPPAAGRLRAGCPGAGCRCLCAQLAAGPARALEALQKRQLAAQQLDARGGQVEPARAVDLGKGLVPARAARPFELEAVAADLARVELAALRPRAHHLAAGLLDRAKLDRFAPWRT